MPHETGTPEVGVIAEVTLFHTSLYPIRRRTNAGDSAIQTISSTSWVTLIGKAKVVDDLEKLRELRNTFAEAWMPEGPEDPNAVLIRVNVERGEYWDTPGGRVVSLVSLIQFHRLTGTGVRLDYRPWGLTIGWLWRQDTTASMVFVSALGCSLGCAGGGGVWAASAVR